MVSSEKKMKVLHITPHLGGGVGHVLLHWLCADKAVQHSVVTLDFANEKAQALCQKQGIALCSQATIQEIFTGIQENDIVLMHFWNHPLLYAFLVNNTLPPCRMIVYSHISGLELPNVLGQKVLSYADKCVYTTPISREIQDNTVIFSTGGIEHVRHIPTKTKQGFVAGYIGTVDYAKMHPEYVPVLSAVQGVEYIIVGGDNHAEIAKTAPDTFVFTGKVSDVRPYLAQMDIFAYLLNPIHFGTAEQVLQEAMAAGVVPVVLHNKCEASIVQHGKTGLVAENLQQYADYVALLRDDVALRQRLSQQAQAFAFETFSLEKFVAAWHVVFMDVMHKSSTVKQWPLLAQKPLGTYAIFLESLGDASALFAQKTDCQWRELLGTPHWQSQSKGTPLHYASFLEVDADLQRILYLYPTIEAIS